MCGEVLVLRTAPEKREDSLTHKQHLVSLFVAYLCGNYFVPSSTLPILVNNKNETFKIASSVTKVFDCNR